MLYLQKPDFPDWILTKKGTRTSESEEQILKRSSQHSKRSPAPTWMYSIILVLVTMGLCCVRYGVKDWTTDDRIKQRIYMSLCVWAYVCVCVCLSYADGLWGEVALGDHEVAGFVQLDDGSSVGLYLSLKRLVFLELALSTHTHTPTPVRDPWRMQDQAKKNTATDHSKIWKSSLTGCAIYRSLHQVIMEGLKWVIYGVWENCVHIFFLPS